VNPKISIIIATYNGAEKLPNILQALKNQSFRDFEVLVMIDGSTDNSEEVAWSWKNSFEKFSVHKIPNSGRSVIRNTGARMASTELLLFFDDDMRPLPNCVALHWEHHQKHPGSIVTGGLSEDPAHCTKDIHLYKVHLSEKWTAPLVRLEGIPLNRSNFFVTAANLSLSKRLFDQLKGFNERLTDAEDYELGLRALKQQVQLFYAPKAFAWHDDYKSAAGLIKRQRQYAQMNRYLIDEGIIPADEVTKAAMQLSMFKKLFFRLFTFRFWINSIDNSRIWNIMPQKIRYKFYDWIITSNGTYYIYEVKL